MRKIYTSLLVFLFIGIQANAQFTDDFESYALGTYHGGNWSSWSGNSGSEDIIVSNTYAFDGTQSGLIGGSTVQDAMLVLGNLTSGVYALTFQVYIPAGKSAYMNFQGTTTANGGAFNGGVFNSPNLIFNNVQSANGAPGLGGAYGNVTDANAIYTWSYPESTWFPVVIEFDIDNGMWTMGINGVNLAPQPFDDENVLGAIDFYSYDANNEMYIDAIVFENTLDLDDHNLIKLKAYPNPVSDILNISLPTMADNIEIYDILGQKILEHQPTSLNSGINMSHLSSGTYYVRASFGNKIETIKIIK